MYPYHAFFFPGMMPFFDPGLGLVLGLLIILLAVWSLVWKGLALWFAARNDQRAWYVALLIINTAGILEIIYLVWFRTPKAPITPSLFEAPAAPAKEESSAEARPE